MFAVVCTALEQRCHDANILRVGERRRGWREENRD